VALTPVRNDLRVREQAQSGTYLSHTHSDEGGRFAQIGAAHVVGSTPLAPYPAASAAHQIQLPDEPPLGLDNSALDPQSMTAEGSGSGADAPLALSPCVEPAPLSSHDGPAGTNPEHFPPRPARNPRDPGRHPFRRRV
jgi:hypothetical protein